MTPTPPPDARVTLLFEKFSAFVEDYASNLSMGGMFLETNQLRPAGSIVEFEVKLTDGFQLVQGLGEVVWVMPGDSRAPAGLAIRFQSLDERGRELILKILEEQVKGGGGPFDLEDVPAGALTAAGGEPAAGAVSEDAAPGGAGAVAPLPDAGGGEAKILGEDGFTLLDAAGSPPGPAAAQPQRTFEELEFDAPWGERLPEIPREVLEESLEAEVVLPRPEEAAASGESPPEDSFLLAEEAVAELDLTPPAAAGEPDFEDIDFGVAAAEPAPPALRAAASEDVFELEWEAEPTPCEAPQAEEEGATLSDQWPAEAGAVDDEDPTLLTSGARVAPLPKEPPAVESPGTTNEDSVLAATDEGEAGPFELAPETSAAAVRVAPAEELPAAAAAADLPDAVQDYEDDLFVDASGGGTGQVLRQTLAGSARSIALAALVLALVGAAYVYRGSVAELVGFGGAAVEPPAAQAPAAQARPTSLPVEPRPAGPGELGGEAVAAAPPEVADDGLSPPVIDVAVEEATETSPRAEPASPAAEPAPAGEPAAAQEESAAAQNPPVVGPRSLPAAAVPEGSPATRVDRIAARRAEGGTLVTVELDGELAARRWVHSPLTWAPDREMVEILGIAEPYVSGRIAVGSAEVEQIRIGYHLRPGGNVLRIVLDFPGAGPRVTEVRGLGNRLEILVLR